jgi:hypothetical protein
MNKKAIAREGLIFFATFGVFLVLGIILSLFGFTLWPLVGFAPIAGKVKDKHRYGDILISQEVQKHVKNHFDLKEEPALEDLRNISERHRCWSVLKRRSSW